MAKIDTSSMELEEKVVTINRVSKTVKGVEFISSQLLLLLVTKMVL